MPDPTDPQATPWLLLLLVYGLPVLALIFFGFVGAWVERRHYASIRAREAATSRLPIVTLKTIPDDAVVAQAWLVAADVVISQDHFKRFLANLRKIFGGRLGSYETLLDRARREALLRLKEQNPSASLIANLRLESSCIARSTGNKGVVGVEIVAYGTAVRFAAERARGESAAAA